MIVSKRSFCQRRLPSIIACFAEFFDTPGKSPGRGEKSGFAVICGRGPGSLHLAAPARRGNVGHDFRCKRRKSFLSFPCEARESERRVSKLRSSFLSACPRPCARESSAPSCEVMRSCCSRRDDEGAVLRFCVRSCGLHRRWMAHPFMRDIQVCSYAAIAAMRSGAAKKDIFFVWDLKNFSFGGIIDYRKMSLFGMGTVQGNHSTEGGIPTWM